MRKIAAFLIGELITFHIYIFLLDIRKRARNLENEVDTKLVALSKVSQVDCLFYDDLNYFHIFRLVELITSANQPHYSPVSFLLTQFLWRSRTC